MPAKQAARISHLTGPKSLNSPTSKIAQNRQLTAQNATNILEIFARLDPAARPTHALNFIHKLCG
jgi:hypothetical protein